MSTRRINFIEAAMKHPQITIAITTILVITGIVALLNMPRSENPRIAVRQGVVYALYPGADEAQVEKQVTNKIEQYLFSFEEVKKAKTHSETKTGQVAVFVELNNNIDDSQQFWNTLQRGLSNVLRPTLPPGVVGPVVNSDFGDVVVEMITISAPGRSYADLDKYLDKLEDGIKTIPEVSKINRYGGQRQQVAISVSDEKLRQYGIDFSYLAGTLQAQNVTNYTGELTIASNKVPIIVQSRFADQVAIGNQIVYSSPDGKIVRLRDVATITRKYEEPSSYIEVGGNKVMMLTIQKQPGKNIVFLGDALDKRIKEVKADLPADVQVNTIADQPKVVKHAVNNFMFEFAISIVSVIIVVMILLPFRVASISAIAAPISIAITFGIINLLKIEINNVSLIAMIIVLGMLVDDAVVIVDNYIEKLDEGLPRWTAAWESATQLLVPVFTATACIIFAFLPLDFMLTGIEGDFIYALPITIAVALSASFLVAILLTPYLSYHFLKKGLKHKMDERSGRRSILDRVQDGFNQALEFCFKWPKTTMSMGIVSLVLAMVVASTLKQELFPYEDRNQFNMEVWMPNGTSLDETAKAVNKVEAAIKGDKCIVSTASFVGTSSPRFHYSYAPETPRENYAQIFINTLSEEATVELIHEYLEKFKNFLPEGYVRIRQLSNKQTPAPVEIRIVGDDMKDQKLVAAEVEKIIAKQKNTYWIRTDYEDEFFGVKAVVKADVANRLGVTNAMITGTLGEVKGYPVTTLWEGEKPVDLMVRLDTNERRNFADLGNLYVTTALHTKVPLKELVAFQPAWHTGTIAHRNGLRTLTVLSEVDRTTTAITVMGDIDPQIKALKLPPGISINYGGEFYDANEQSPDMGKALGISLILILITLLFQFKSIGRVLIVFSTFPLSLLGAMLGLKITGNPISFTAFMGFIALLGIVVRNGIILVDYADEMVREHGYSIKDAAMAAGKRRMRPIFLTSLAAASGLVPMILTRSALWSPLGSVLAAGLLFSMIMTLFIVPMLYYRFIKPQPEPASSDIQPGVPVHI